MPDAEESGDGWVTPLHTAIDRPDHIKLLLAAGAPVNGLPGQEDKPTPLGWSGEGFRAFDGEDPASEAAYTRDVDAAVKLMEAAGGVYDRA